MKFFLNGPKINVAYTMKRDERREGEEETDRLRVKGGKGYDRIEKKSRGIGDQITFMIFRFCNNFQIKSQNFPGIQ